MAQGLFVLISPGGSPATSLTDRSNTARSSMAQSGRETGAHTGLPLCRRPVHDGEEGCPTKMSLAPPSLPFLNEMAPPEFHEMASSARSRFPADSMHHSLPVMASLRVAVKASKLDAAEGDKTDEPTKGASGSTKGNSVAAFYADDVPKGMPQSPGTRVSSFAMIPVHGACGEADGDAHSQCTLKITLTNFSMQAGRCMPCLKTPRQAQRFTT